MKKITSCYIEENLIQTAKIKNCNISDLVNSLLIAHFEQEKSETQQLQIKSQELRAKINVLQAELSVISNTIAKREEIEQKRRKEDWEKEKKRIRESKDILKGVL